MVRCQLVTFCLVAVGVTLGADVDVQSLDTADLVPLQQVKSLHIKEWTIDFQNELDSGFRSAVAADQLATIDFEKFIYDIIVGNVSSRHPPSHSSRKFQCVLITGPIR